MPATITRPHRTNVRHGDPSCYRYGCRRPECTTAYYRARKATAVQLNRGQRATVDAAPATARVRRLIDAGMPASDIAAAANVSTETVRCLAAGTYQRIYRTTAAVLFAVPAPPRGYRPVGDGLIDATAATRRIRAMSAIGYTLPALAQATGLSRRTVQFIRAGRQQWVRVSNHLAVRDACERLWRTDPTEHGVPPEGAAKTRRWAARQGWVPLACWDDDRIGDPTARPHGAGAVS